MPDPPANPPYIKRLKRVFNIIRATRPWSDNPMKFNAEQIKVLEDIVVAIADDDEVHNLPFVSEKKDPL